MERIWRLAKVIAFILSLTAFVYVGYITSQNGRYKPIPNRSAGGQFIVIDTQTGCINAYNLQGDVFYKYDSVNQLFHPKVKE